MNFIIRIWPGVVSLILSYCIGISCQAEPVINLVYKVQTDTTKAFVRNRIIGRGINFGNALEAPNEGEWGLTIKESYIQAVSEAGFNSVRIPISWSTHTSRIYPYIISSSFLKRIDEVTGWCLNRKLAVIITIHHFDELYNDPDDTVYQNITFSIWKQLSKHYISVSQDSLFFEVMNEPEVNLTSDKWNAFLPQIIDTIRRIDKDRTLIIDGPDYAYHGSLTKLIIPETEQNIIVSTRYYLPMNFAQQGAWWMPEMKQYLGTTWTGKSNEKNTVLADMAFIKNWSVLHNRPITIGEYGSIIYADNQSRLTWTNYIRTEFELHKFSWSYFDFGMVFKAYSITENKWLYGFVQALTGNSRQVSDARSSDSLVFKPGNSSEEDSVVVNSYIKIPNLCSPCDSVSKSVSSGTIRITAFHSEHIPQSVEISTCVDEVSLGRLKAGTYTVIFNSDYIDVMNTIHYSIVDTARIQILKSTGVNSENVNPIQVYPVPASRYLNIVNAKSSARIEIFDLKGQLKLSGLAGDGRIKISDLIAGEYILNIISQDKSIINKKIIVN